MSSVIGKSPEELATLREKRKEITRRYRENNRRKINAKASEYRENNKEIIKTRSSEYYIRNKEKIKARVAEYYINNKEKIKVKKRDRHTVVDYTTLCDRKAVE